MLYYLKNDKEHIIFEDNNQNYYIIEKLLENGFVNNDNILSKQISENMYCYYNKHSDISKLFIENENVKINIYPKNIL